MTRILMVDDNDSDFELLSLVMAERTHPVALTHVADGERAMRLLDATSAEQPFDYDLLLLDLHLPLVNGLDILAFARGDRRFDGTPIVVLSSSDHYTDRNEAKRLKADGYLLKPSDYQGYIDVAERILAFVSA